MAKNRKDQDGTIDFGAPGLGRHFTVVPKLTRGLHGFNAKVVDETEIDRMLLHDRITSSQHATLEALMMRLHRMGFVGVKSPNYDAAVHVDPATLADRKARTLVGMVGIFAGLDAAIGRERRFALVNLLLKDTPWPFGDIADCITALDLVLAGQKQ